MGEGKTYLDELHAQVDALLREYGVYDVDSYGWLNENDVDPETVGFAMWTLDRPYEPPWMARQSDAPPDRRPTEQQQHLVELGEDFEAVTKAARYAIGMALVYREEAMRRTGTPNLFEFQVLSAIMTLKIAADRARDFVIWAVLNEMPRSGREYDQFRLALCEARAKGANIVVDEMIKVSERLEGLRLRRNAAVHRIALDVARQHRLLIQEDRDAFDRRKWPTKRPKLKAAERWFGPMSFEDDAARAEIEQTLQELRSAYEDTLKVGDLAFRIENAVRVRQR